jgi:hypothetical protein
MFLRILRADAVSNACLIVSFAATVISFAAISSWQPRQSCELELRGLRSWPMLPAIPGELPAKNWGDKIGGDESSRRAGAVDSRAPGTSHAFSVATCNNIEDSHKLL